MKEDDGARWAMSWSQEESGPVIIFEALHEEEAGSPPSVHKFAVQEMITAGQQGVVYRVTAAGAREYALKVVPGSGQKRRVPLKTALERAEREVSVLESLQSVPDVVRLHAVYRISDRPFRSNTDPDRDARRRSRSRSRSRSRGGGGSDINFDAHCMLLEWIEPRGEIVHDDKIRKVICDRAWGALMFIHETGVAHLDIKLDNLIFDGTTVRFIDFGIACTTAARDCDKAVILRDRPGSFSLSSNTESNTESNTNSRWSPDNAKAPRLNAGLPRQQRKKRREQDGGEDWFTTGKHRDRCTLVRALTMMGLCSRNEAHEWFGRELANHECGPKFGFWLVD